MSETPRTGDRVRVTPKPFEGEMTCDGSQGRLIQVRDDEGRLHAFGPVYATVEVLTPPLCPETEGATGIRCQQPTGHVDGHKGTTTEAQTKAVGYPLFVSWPAESEPPARKQVRVPNEPHGLPTSARPNVALLVRAGDVTGAIKAVRAATYWPLHEARSYVEDMEEYQVYLSKHDEKREPRVFRADELEPPQGVTVLEDTGPAWGDMKYLVRAGDQWCWSPSREVIGPDHSDPCPWAQAAGFADGPLVEVLS